MQELLWAIRFLTIIPAGKEMELPQDRIGRVMALYPAVGLIIGLCLVLVHYPLATRFPSALADAFIILFYIFLTGALHMDGLADSMDGLMGGWDKKSRLEIMKDSRIGSLGTIGIVSDIGLRFLFLQFLPTLPEIGEISFAEVTGLIYPLDRNESYLLSEETLEKELSLLIMPVVGRWAQTLSASTSTYARQEAGTASVLVTNARLSHCLAGSVLPIVLMGGLYGTGGVIMFGLMCAAVLLLNSYTKSRIGGITGDTLGMTNEVSELTFLFLFFVV